MIELGKSYYFLTHAYHHFLGTVTEVTGRKECVLSNVRRIQSCTRNWTRFFANGARKDTNFTTWPDGTEITGWFVCAPWKHPIPPEEHSSAR